MKLKKVLLTALCCAMAVAAFAACEKDEGGSKKPGAQQNPSAQTPNTQTPTLPETPVVKTVTEEQWVQIFKAMPTVNNATVNAITEQYESSALTYRSTVLLQVAGNKGYEKVDDNGDIEETYWTMIDGNAYEYQKGYDGKWDKFASEDAENYPYDLRGFYEMFEAFKTLYSQLAYDNATGLYSAQNVSVAETEFMLIQVGFANGKLNSIAYQYQAIGTDTVTKESYTFSNYGATKITLPDEPSSEPDEPNAKPVEPHPNPDGPTDGGDSEVALLLDDLLNTTAGTLNVYDYVFEDEAFIEERYLEQAVSSKNNIKHVSESWHNYQDYRAGASEYYYTSVNGRSYAYEYSTESYLWSKYELEEEISYNFQELADMWYWEDLQACIPYLEFNESNNHYRAKSVYVDDGEEYTIDATISVEDGRIAQIQMVLNADTWSEEIAIQLNYSDPMLELPYVEGDNETGGDDAVDEPDPPAFGESYDFYVIDQYGNPLPGYSVQLSTDTDCLPPVEVGTDGWTWCMPSDYGYGEDAYNITVYDKNYNEVKFEGAYQTGDYGEYELVVYVEESAEGGDAVVDGSDFTVTDTDGEVFQLSQALKENDLVLINFWATWCRPCKEETPALQAIVDEYEGRLAFIGISITDESNQEINEYRIENGLTLRMVSCIEGAGLINSYIGDEMSVPHAFIMNGNREIVFDHLGSIKSVDDWRMIIDCLLAGKEAPDIGDSTDEQEWYSFLVRDYNNTPLTGYRVQLSTEENVFPEVTVGENGLAYFYPSDFGYGEAEYQITLIDEYGNYVNFDGPQYTEGYAEYWLYVYSAEGGDSSAPDEDMSGVWYDAFNNTFAANDFTVEMELYTTAQMGNAMYQVDDGYKAYERNYMYDSSTKETLEEYDIYYVRLETGDYVYEFDATQGGYVCNEKALDDELFSMRYAGNVLYGISEMYDVMEYQGNDFFHMNEDYMNENFNIFARMDRIEVALMDGYVNAVRFYGYDEEGNEQHMSYIFYNYGETIVELPEVLESGSTNNNWITNY